MNKYLVPIGMVWVGLALIIGTVVMFDSVKTEKNTSVNVPGGTVKEVRYIIEKDEPNPPTAGEAKVNIKGTYGENATAKVEIKK